MGMRTRSVTEIHEAGSLNEILVCRFFRHHDGYPDGHGLDLAKWVEGKRLANGINENFEKGVDFISFENFEATYSPTTGELEGMDIGFDDFTITDDGENTLITYNSDDHDFEIELSGVFENWSTDDFIWA